MSGLVARILLAILMLPAATVLCVVVAVIADRAVGYGTGSSDRAHFVAGITCLIIWAFVGIYWFLLWRTTVRWSGQRIRLTILALIGAAVVGVVAAMM